MIDVVYKLGPGSKARDWELKISLRSLDQHFADLGKVWVIGHKPKWLSPAAIHIPFAEPYAANKDGNLCAKLVRMGFEPTLTDDFIFQSDDQFWLKSTRWADVCEPYYVEDLALRRKWGDGQWFDRLQHTAAVLKARGFPRLNYEAHCPYPIRKRLVGALLEWPFGASPGMNVHTTYFNANRIEGLPITIEPVKACLHGKDWTAATIREATHGRRFANINGPSVRSRAIRQHFDRLFPAPSRFEL